MKFKNLIIYLALIFTTLQLTAAESVTLNSIEFKSENVSIILSNGAVCIWRPENFEKEMLNSWKEGDVIIIGNHPNKEGLVLLNDSCDILYCPQVFLTNESIKLLPTIEKIVSEESVESEMTLFIHLSDGSCWKNFYSVKLQEYWKIGDHVIINVEVEDDNRIYANLINYDLAWTSDYIWADTFCKKSNP